MMKEKRQRFIRISSGLVIGRVILGKSIAFFLKQFSSFKKEIRRR